MLVLVSMLLLISLKVPPAIVGLVVNTSTSSNIYSCINVTTSVNASTSSNAISSAYVTTSC